MICIQIFQVYFLTIKGLFQWLIEMNNFYKRFVKSVDPIGRFTVNPSAYVTLINLPYWRALPSKKAQKSADEIGVSGSFVFDAGLKNCDLNAFMASFFCLK